MSKKFFALLLMAVMMLFAVSAVAADNDCQHLNTISWVSDPATCSTTGWRSWYCTDCNEKLDDTLIDKDINTHSNLVNGEAQAPYCNQEYWGAYQYCKDCGFTSKDVKTDLVGKSHELEEVKGSAQSVTCQNGKGLDYKCTNYPCVYTVEGAVLEATEEKKADFHSKPSEHVKIYSVAAEMTCKQDGVKVGFICDLCDDDTAEITPADAVSFHDNEKNWEPYSETATCKVPGLANAMRCKECKELIEGQEGDPIPVLTGKDLAAYHKSIEKRWVPVKAEPASCIKAGRTAGSKCPECQTIVQGYKVITPEEAAAAYHANEANLDPIVYKPAECLEDGNEAGFRCKNYPKCSYKIGGASIPAYGSHDFSVDMPRQDATCLVPGHTAYKQCSRCEEKDGYAPLPAGSGKHDWNPETGVCNECKDECKHVAHGKDGVCKECGKTIAHTYNTNGVCTCGAECAHVWGAEIVEDNGNCYTEKKVSQTCGVCGKVKTELKGYQHDLTEIVVDKGSCETEKLVRVTCKDCPYTEVLPKGFVHDYEIKMIPGTCQKQPWVGKVCKICEAKGEGKYVGEVTDHKWVLSTKPGDYKAATCDETGWQVKVCSVCKTPVTENYPKLGHDLVETSTVVDATCKENGGILLACSRCDYTEVKVLLGADGKPVYPAIGKEHDWNVKPVNATCVSWGYNLKTCKNCGTQVKEYTTDAVNTTAHKKVLADTLRPATCTTNGIGKYRCELCGKDLGYDIISTDKAHTAELTSKTPATCKDAGIEHYRCTTCGKTWTKDLPATGAHNYVETIVRGDCSKEEYLKKGLVCTVCKDVKGELVSTGEKTPHAWVLNTNDKAYVKAVPCSEKYGMDAFVCEECKATDYKTTYGDHNWEVTTIKVAPSCGQDGGYVQVCKDCAKEGIFVPMSNGKPVFPATEAHAKKVVDSKASTCHEYGYKQYQCTKCGAEWRENAKALDAYNHDYVVVKTLKPADCNNKGIVLKACKYGCENAKFYAVTDEAHTWVTVEYKAPTCQPGYEDKTCSKCGVNTGREVLKAVQAHKYVKTVKPATCEDLARIGYFCEVCGEQNMKEAWEDIPNSLKDHTPTEKKVTKPATCTEDGEYTSKCAVCDDEFTGKINNNGGHSYVKGELVKADCVNAGGYKYTCSKCNDSYVDRNADKYPAVGGHAALAGSKKEIDPTCVKAGYYQYTCANCGEKYEGEPTGKGKDSTKHNVTELVEVKVAATCTTDGSGVYRCADCKADSTKVTKVIKADHTWDKGTELVAGDCGNGAKVEYKCTVKDCGATKTETAAPSGKHTWTYNLTNDTKDVVYKQCDVCGKREVTEDLRGNQDDKTACALYGHKVVEVAAVAPTCTEKGLTAGTKCDVCNKVLKAQEEVAAKGHTFAFGTCTVCGAADPDYVPHAHKYTKSYDFNADFTKRVVTYTCECGYTYSEEEDF